MGFLLAAAVLLLVVALVLRSASPRRALALGALGACAVAAGLVLLLVDRGRHGPASIPPETLTVTDLHLNVDQYGAQASGRVVNRSGVRLGTLTLAIAYRTCSAKGACEALGEEQVRLFLALPSGQTGRFSTLLARSDLAAKPGVSIEARVVAAAADF
jgi:hypothetical protein